MRWWLAFLALSALVGAAGRVESDGSVELLVLSYNTHGLVSWIAGDDPETRFPKISLLTNRYDVALIQEDWSYHDALVGASRHEVVEQGNESRLWLADWLPLFGGSGLTTLVRERDWVTSVTREAYRVCAGWLGGANDCMGSKGFLRVRLEPAPGKVLDVYQTHLDAGDGVEDQAARLAQLEHLARRVRESSGEGALILAGDLNLKREVPAHRQALAAFARSLELVDSGAEPAPDTGWLRVDYIFYRSGNGVTLELVEAGEALEFRDEGGPFSDHPALLSRFRLR